MSALISFVIVAAVALLIAEICIFIVRKVPIIDNAIKQIVEWAIYAVTAIYLLMEILKLVG